MRAAVSIGIVWEALWRTSTFVLCSGGTRLQHNALDKQLIYLSIEDGTELAARQLQAAAGGAVS